MAFANVFWRGFIESCHRTRSGAHCSRPDQLIIGRRDVTRVVVFVFA